MASIKRTGITNDGKSLVAREIAGETEIIFTNISASSKKLEESTNLETLTNLDEVRQTVRVSKVEKLGVNKIKITATFNNSGLTSGYSMETLALYAKDTAGTEILFSITSADIADYMPATNRINLSTITVELLFNISNTEKVSLSVNTEALVTVEMLNTLKSKISEDYVKYTDVAEESKAGIVTLSKIREIAPQPDLSPYLKYDKTFIHKGDNINSGHNKIIRCNNSDVWVPRHLNMYSDDNPNTYQGTFRLNGGRAYYKVPNRNGGNWCEIMDNHDMAARDNRMNQMDADRNGIRGRADDAWNRTQHLYNLRDVDNNDKWVNYIRDIRLAGRINALVYRANNGGERGGYVVTGVENWNEDDHPDQIHMRALQFYRNGNWYNVPFA